MTVASTNRRHENDWQLFKRLIPYARQNGRLLTISLILLVPVAIAGAIQPIVIGQAITFIQCKGNPGACEGLAVPLLQWFLPTLNAATPLFSGLDRLTAILLGTIILRLAFRGWQGYLVQEVGQRMTASIREDMFGHVTSLAVRFFDRTPVGKLITRLTSDVEALGDVFSTGAIGIVSDIFSLITLTVAMFLLQWQPALMLTVMLLPVTVIIVYFQREYRLANAKARDELSSLNAMLQENVMGIDVVQLFRREQYNSGLFRTTNQRYITEIDKTIFHDSAISATLEWISLAAIAGVLYLGSRLLLDGPLGLGQLASFIIFAQKLFDPLRQLAEKFTSIQSGLTAVERISDLLSEPIEIQDRTDNIATLRPSAGDHRARGAIRFENVWFGYKPDEFVLQNLDFEIQPGEKIALVGPTGAGKSSIIRLLCRLYEPSRGRILIDGIDIRDLPQAELRRHLGVVLQDGFLFAGDVKSNISLGESYPDWEIEQAAEKTNVNRFIEGLPQGYNTQLRQRGANLSGGQKQLLAFARVAIRDPGILILDEATSNLDVGTEADIQAALDVLLEQRTAIIIAHRLSTIRNVDRILVLKQGQLVESGSHQALLDQGGLYASLYQLQLLGTDQ
ncbi:MAG: ABC transporter ATP-binding protein [Synechococcales cyanobacterium RM1_1_8]|nr:ABC transporter ATP-binding protein [Synechococcales cyanobacterium RM1_1_8]